MDVLPSPLRLCLDGTALVANWSAMAKASGAAACGAAIKANGYGLGARAVLERLAGAGCRDFFVATWAEASALGPIPVGCSLSVLHGPRAEDMDIALAHDWRPVINTAAQLARWKPTGRPCDIMVDTGMNRLGLSLTDIGAGLLDGLKVETLMSHLASADDASAQSEEQLHAFHSLSGKTAARRMSLANSAGIALGADYAFQLTRPGLALYGGVPTAGLASAIRQVAYPQSQIIQRRRLKAGDAIGYNAIFRAPRDMEVALLNIGYADGYFRGFSNRGSAGGGRFPVVGRVSMDLTAINVDAEPSLGEGDWVAIDYHLPDASAASGLSQYELLTGLGQRLDRVWI